MKAGVAFAISKSAGCMSRQVVAPLTMFAEEDPE
jgi:hypothetical protein